MSILEAWFNELSTTFILITLLDLAIVGFILYRLFIIIRGTRAVQLLKGLAVLVIANLVSQWMGLNITSWLFGQALTIGIIALPIIFYPELRRALEQLGRGRIFPKISMLGPQERAQAVESVVKAVSALARRRVGALIVWEQETGLKDWAETGVAMDSQLSSELLVNIFEPNTPLHDGAIIIRGNRIQAASCYLPLSDNPDLRVDLGTRHRAALGITEHSDAVSVVVSEETGAISMATGGAINRYLDEKTLREQLDQYLKARQQEHALFTKRWQPHWKE